MKRKKITKAAAMGLCAAMLLAGCGSTGGNNASGSASTGTTEKTQEASKEAGSEEAKTKTQEALKFKVTTVYFGEQVPGRYRNPEKVDRAVRGKDGQTLRHHL